MKLINTLAIGLLAFAGLTSCEMKDEIKGGKDSSEVGYLELGVSVDAKKNQITKAAENTGTGTVGNTYKELQAEGAIELPVGNYKIESHSAEELKDVMDQPYFAGSTNLSILKGVKSDATVLCGMLNTKISLSYESQFLASMQDWTITISDGKHIITYTGTSSNPGTPQPKYVVIAENTSKLIVTVTGTKIDGEKVNESRNITKPTGSNSEYWGAADDLSIKMNINEAVVVPGVSGITITVDVTFAETEDTVEIEVTPEEGGGTNPDPETPEEPSSLPMITSDYLEIPITGTVDGETITNTPDAALVNIKADAGLKSLQVKITAGNTGFAGALEPLGLDSSNSMDAILIEVLKPLPQTGDKAYSLDIAKFISMMGAYGVTNSTGHQFDITVVDANGKEAKATLFVILNAK